MSPLDTSIVILDLEWNAAYCGKLGGFLNEIIEFGAVRCRVEPDGALTPDGQFSELVRPRVSKRMNPYTAELTSLSLDTLEEGQRFPTVLKKFSRWAGDSLVMTWGASDILSLMENCRYFFDRDTVPFLSRYCNLQNYAQQRMGISTKDQLGLSRAAELLDIDASAIEQHRALGDSVLTFEILKKVFDPQAIAPFVETCDEEFYRKISFKNGYVTDLDDPRIPKEWLSFPCPECGGETKRKSRWVPRNHGNKASFLCQSCGFGFTGRLTIRERYEGLSTVRKTARLPVIEERRPLPEGPVPVEEMLLVPGENGAALLRFPQLEALPWVNASFSTRIGGVSKGEFAAMNLGFGRGDSEKAVAENYRILCAAGGFDPESLVCGAQDHHLNIRRVTAEHRGIGIWKEKDMESIDALCTDDPAVTLVIYCADCVPLYFADERHRAIGLAHAGWKGTMGGMAREMALKMGEEFGSLPTDLVVCIGPSIGPQSFQVDKPVAEEFLALPETQRFVRGPVTLPTGEEKFYVDLWACNKSFLLAAGVPDAQIHISGVDTLRNSDLLFSHRKTGGRRGSNAAFLSLR